MKKIIFLIAVYLFLAVESFAENISPNQSINDVFGKNKYYKSHLNKDSSHDTTFYKSATLVIIHAKKNLKTISSENRFILRRPLDTEDPDYYGSGIPLLSYNTTDGHFKIHYTEDNTNGDAVYGFDGDPSTVPEFVLEVGSAFERAWNHIISLNFPAIPEDNNNGGDNRYDIYILNIPGSYGYTSYDDSPVYTYTVIDNDFATVPKNLDPDGTQQGAVKVTAAHELFHAFQFQYSTDVSKNGWWMEASSTWMEDEVFPEVKDYLNYIGLKYDDINDNGKWDIGETYYKIDGSVAGTSGRSSKFFDNPDMSLDTHNGSHEYGTVVWAKYLSKIYGSDVIESIWNRIGNGLIAVQSIADELSYRQTDLEDIFGLFQLANYKKDYTDGNYYPLIKHEATYTSYPQTVSGSIDHLASNFYAFNADSYPSILTFTFSNMNKDFSCKLILTTTKGSYREEDIILNGNSVIKHITSFGTSLGYSKAVLIIINTSLTDKQIFTVNIEKSKQSSSSECFIATAAFGSPLARQVEILRQFRDKYLLTNKLGQKFVSWYYRNGPFIAHFIKDKPLLKTTVRLALYPLIGFAYILILGYSPIVILVFLVIFLFSNRVLPYNRRRENAKNN